MPNSTSNSNLSIKSSVTSNSSSISSTSSELPTLDEKDKKHIITFIGSRYAYIKKDKKNDKYKLYSILAPQDVDYIIKSQAGLVDYNSDFKYLLNATDPRLDGLSLRLILDGQDKAAVYTAKNGEWVEQKKVSTPEEGDTLEDQNRWWHKIGRYFFGKTQANAPLKKILSLAEVASENKLLSQALQNKLKSFHQIEEYDDEALSEINKNLSSLLNGSSFRDKIMKGESNKAFGAVQDSQTGKLKRAQRSIGRTLTEIPSLASKIVQVPGALISTGLEKTLLKNSPRVAKFLKFIFATVGIGPSPSLSLEKYPRIEKFFNFFVLPILSVASLAVGVLSLTGVITVFTGPIGIAAGIPLAIFGFCKLIGVIDNAVKSFKSINTDNVPTESLGKDRKQTSNTKSNSINKSQQSTSYGDINSTSGNVTRESSLNTKNLKCEENTKRLTSINDNDESKRINAVVDELSTIAHKAGVKLNPIIIKDEKGTYYKVIQSQNKGKYLAVDCEANIHYELEAFCKNPKLELVTKNINDLLPRNKNTYISKFTNDEPLISRL
jgi:hypothetical protein